MKYLFFIFLSHSLLAQPQHFNGNVFVDFIQADYVITINPGIKKNTVVSTIKINQDKRGHILFDLDDQIESIEVDQSPTQAYKIHTPNRETTLRKIALKTEPGIHELKITHYLNKLLFNRHGMYFKMRDLFDRQMLEQYLPTNLEFDQYQMNLELKLNLENKMNFELMTNAVEMKRIEEGHWRAKYPDFYNASSMFFHVINTNDYYIKTFDYISKALTLLPVTIYGRDLDSYSKFKAKTLEVLAELEDDYGPFPHQKLMVYAEGDSGGMEFAGATESSLYSLGHELFHSYFGRSILPQDGNAGALDEALASWRDYGYQNRSDISFQNSGICHHSEYQRKTDKKSYAKGRAFFSYLDYHLKAQGGVKKFLKQFHDKYKHKTISKDNFAQEMSLYFESDLVSEFSKYL